ncbi:MAG TPA: hypothetical protein ENL10_00140, partial [Candidatus Cloacimonetes bacterium]|nr:hypothetical protein [Candidatus Cloacimonadota bacterium]
MRKILFFVLITTFILFVFVLGENPQIKMFEKFKGGTIEPLKNKVVIPFTLKRSHIIQIPVNLKNKKYIFILDTGGMTMANANINDSLKYDTMKTPQENVRMALTDEIRLG